MDIVGLTTIAGQIGALGISIIVIWALLTERLVPHGRLEEAHQERDLERHRAEELDLRLDHLADVHEKATELMGEALHERMK